MKDGTENVSSDVIHTAVFSSPRFNVYRFSIYFIQGIERSWLSTMLQNDNISVQNEQIRVLK